MLLKKQKAYNPGLNEFSENQNHRTGNTGVTRPYSWYFNGRDNYPCILMGQQGYQSH